MFAKSKTFNSVLKAGIALGLFALAACPGAGNDRTTYEYMPDMADAQSVKAQEALGRTPPAGTVARGFAIYPYTQEQGDLAGSLTNPSDKTRATLLKGQKLYNTYCIVCHGPKGDGKGFIVPKFPMPPSLHSDKVRQWPDGRIFHVITRGQNLMPSYATQIFPEERWAIVSYIRALQRSMNPTDEDIKAFQEALKNP